jgi:2-iminoacetate synthase ThiH
MADQTNPPTQLPTSPSDDASSPPALTEQDFYYEGQYIVFTAAYHLKRGYCCNSGCRHCPYRDTDES